jgi:FKBP-type peptidyl-prolyl cis-trans isomerase FklB
MGRRNMAYLGEPAHFIQTGEIMKPILTAFLGLGFALTASAQQSTPAKTPAAPAAQAKAPQAATGTLKTDKDKVSYGIGVEFGTSLKSQGIEVDPETLAKGVKDAMAGGKLQMTDDELKQVLTALQEQLKLKAEEAKTALSEANKKEAAAFFAANAKNQGVNSLPDGMQYKVLKTGTGPKPTDADVVTLQYRGTLLNGTEFDSSFSTGQPATFQVKGLIPGFREALLLMPVGSTYQFFIPSELAYGENGAGEVIGPNAALIFQIELLSIEPASGKAAAPGAAPAPAPAQ